MKERFYKSSYFKEKEKKDFTLTFKTSSATVPKNALVELTNGCNHACVFCYNPEMKRKIKNVDIKKYKDFIELASKEGLEEVGLYSTGEPFMTKNLEEFISIAKKSGIKRVYITSNGALANMDKIIKCIDHGLDSIKFSINAGSRETYKIIHGHDDFDKVIKNIKDLYEYRNSKNLNFQIMSSFIYTDLTHSEIEPFKEKYGKYFEDMFFQKAINQGGRKIDEAKKLTGNLEKLNKKKEIKSFKPCSMIWNRLHFTAEGYLTACCVDYEGDLIYNKFDKKKKIIDQFNNKKIKELRDKHLKNDLDGTICKNCIYNSNDNYESIGDFTVNRMKQSEKKMTSLKKRIDHVVNNNKV